jgi:hypothetical protein
MRITIEIDEKSGTAPANSSVAITGSAPSSPGPATPAVSPASGPPPDILAVAAATGAINAGPAPTLSQTNDSAPHPFISQGDGMPGSMATTAAISAGSAAQSKPCG